MPYVEAKGFWQWTEREDQMVSALAKDKFSVAEVASAVRCDRATLLHRYPVEMFTPQPIGGQSKLKFTPQQIEMMQTMARNGVAFEQVAQVMGCNPQTLINRFGALLRDAVVHANSEVASALFSQAQLGNTPAAIFWLKSRAGWKETVTALDLSGSTGVLVVPSSRDPSTWISEQEQADAVRTRPGETAQPVEDRTLASLLGDE